MQPELVSGPRGTYLLDYRGPLHQDHGAVRVRSFDAKRARWRAPRWALGDRQVYSATSSLSEDAGGRLHVVADTRVTGRGRLRALRAHAGEALVLVRAGDDALPHQQDRRCSRRTRSSRRTPRAPASRPGRTPTRPAPAATCA